MNFLRVANRPGFKKPVDILCRGLATKPNGPIHIPQLFTGKRLPAESVAEGRLGKVLWDTSIISDVLDGKKVNNWLLGVMENSSTAVCQYTILEYLSSQKVGAWTSYEHILDILHDKHVAVIGSPCKNQASTSLAAEIMRIRHRDMLKMSHNHPNYERKRKKAETLWESNIVKSRMDLMLACEGHLDGRAFLHADKKFHKFLGDAFNAKGIVSYCVEKKDVVEKVVGELEAAGVGEEGECPV